MPSSATITTFYTFTPSTKAKSGQVNNNFDQFRGHILPFSPNTAAAIGSTYDLGSSEHRWRSAYFDTVDFGGATTTGNWVFDPDTTNTDGALDLLLGTQTICSYFSDGMGRAGLQQARHTLSGSILASTYDQTYTALPNATLTVAGDGKTIFMFYLGGSTITVGGASGLYFGTYIANTQLSGHIALFKDGAWFSEHQLNFVAGGGNASAQNRMAGTGFVFYDIPPAGTDTIYDLRPRAFGYPTASSIECGASGRLHCLGM